MDAYDVLANYIAQAVAKLFQNDAYLLEANAHEIAVNHRIAIYLERYFQLKDLERNRKILSIDLEYNRVVASDPFIQKGKHTMLTFEYSDSNEKIIHIEKDVRPDIVVHKRGSGHYNMLWIETKLGSDCEMCREDREKIFYACTQLGFEIGVALLIDYPSKLLKIYMVTRQELSIEFDFDMSHRKPVNIIKHEVYGGRPEPRCLRELLRCP